MGVRVAVWWEGDQAWYVGKVVRVAGSRMVVCYDDGRSKTHDIAEEYRSASTPSVAADREPRRYNESWPRTEQEAIERGWANYPITSVRGLFGLYSRPGMTGVGLRLSPATKPLDLPAVGSTLMERALMWFEGELISEQRSE